VWSILQTAALPLLREEVGISLGRVGQVAFIGVKDILEEAAALEQVQQAGGSAAASMLLRTLSSSTGMSHNERL
jgi:hypothetical protein